MKLTEAARNILIELADPKNSWNFNDLEEFLNQMSKRDSKLKSYYKGEPYDGIRYDDIPLEILAKYGLTKEILQNINDNTDNYEGEVAFHGNKVTLIGGA